MKKYIYIGQENGKEVVIETEMSKPNTITHSENCPCSECNILYFENIAWFHHLKLALRIEVIGTIPAYWKKGEEVQVRLQHQINFTDGMIDTPFEDVAEKDFNGFYKNQDLPKRIVAIPIDKAVEPEHIADTGKMIETEDDLFEQLYILSRNSSEGNFIYSAKQSFTITRKTTPHE